MTDAEIDHLTIHKYKLRMEALNLRRVDENFAIHKSAWLNQQVKATKESGAGKNKKSVPVFKKFEDFYNYEKQLAQVNGKPRKVDKRKQRMAETAKRLNQGIR